MEPITIYIDGQLDALHLNDLQENVNSLEIQEGQFVILDCTEMNYISSSGLRVFLSMHKDVTAKNGKLIIKNLQPLVKHVFDMTGFSQIFNFEWKRNYKRKRAICKYANGSLFLSCFSPFLAHLFIERKLILQKEKNISPVREKYFPS